MANNQNINKVVYGGQTLVDLTEDSVTPQTLVKGATAHDKSGAGIIGEAELNLVELSYGISTFAEFLAAYQSKKIVYCKASSGTDPAVGSQLRRAFMAYVNNDETPTEVEFQYYRSIATHTLYDQVDEVHIYKLNSTSGWSYLKRKVALGISVANDGGLNRTKTGDYCILSVDNTVLRGKTLTGTLTAGDTAIEIQDDAITANSMIDIYTTVYGLNPTDVTLEDDTLTITFEAQQEDVGVKVRIS